MRVRCVRVEYTEQEQREFIAEAGPVDVGKEYLVVAMWYFGNHLRFVVPNDVGYIYEAPAFLFEVVDPRLSATWQLSVEPQGGFAIEPPEFTSEPHLNEDLADQDPETMAMFQRVMQALEAEEARRTAYESGQPGAAGPIH